MNDSKQRWQLEPPSTGTHVFLFVLVVLLPLGITIGAVLMAFADNGPFTLIAGSRTITIIATAAMVTVLTAPVWWFIARALRRHHVATHDGALEVATTFYKRTLALSELRMDEARVVDLAERTELRPSFKTNGTGLPGLKSGWFRMRNRGKALVATVGGSRVLWLPTRKGYDLLLQPRSPQALLDHLRKMAERNPQR